MTNFLDSMAAASHARLHAEGPDAGALAALIAKTPAAQPLRLARFDIIAEIKKTSPAEGALDAAVDVAARAKQYEQAGAAAVSVLTEPERFHGSLADLGDAVAALNQAPAMRKDFLVDRLQVLQARATGAGGVLLITAMLDDATLEDMLSCALSHELFVLIEAFDEHDVARMNGLLAEPEVMRAARDRQLLFGVNSRDLRSLQVDFDRLGDLVGLLSDDVVKVAESGVSSAAAARAVADMGYQAALVGTALMRAESPQTLLGDMLAAARDTA